VLIGLAGARGAGKTTVARAIIAARGAGQVVSFADPLYALLAGLGVPRAMSRDAKEAPSPHLGGASPREFLLAAGDFIRATCGADYLIRRALARAGSEDVIDDVRTPAEHEAIYQAGGIVIYLTGRGIPRDPRGIPIDNSGDIDTTTRAILTACGQSQS